MTITLRKPKATKTKKLSAPDKRASEELAAQKTALSGLEGMSMPTEADRGQMREIMKRRESPGPRIKVTATGSLEVDYPVLVLGQVLLMDAIGTSDPDFLAGILCQLGSALSRGGRTNESSLNFGLSVVKGIRPRDQVETLLASQMAAVHVQAMTAIARLGRAETLEQLEVHERCANRLARTFAIQMDTLKRYRANGEQKVTVQHVQVNAGGQAVVGNVLTGGGASPEENEATP